MATTPQRKLLVRTKGRISQTSGDGRKNAQRTSPPRRRGRDKGETTKLMKTIFDFFASWLLLAFVSWIVNGAVDSTPSIIAAFIVGLIMTIIVFILNRILFSTPMIHFFYWVLRTLHLRKRAKATFVKEGDMFVLKVDKLDPGEQIEVEGEFRLSNGKMERVDGTKESKRTK